MLAPLTEGDPHQVGRYRLHGRLGAGGMGVVYQGFSPDGSPVAIKLPHEEIASDAEFRVRFRQEVTAARRIHGTFVAKVLDADLDAPRPWMATEYVDGVSLADAVRSHGRLEGTTLTGLAAGLADALVAIHAADVVHRDLKPSNVIMAWDGPKVIDFGIARTTDTSARTSTGVIVGTVAWMAPEQLSGHRAGPAADIFAWGACVAFAATGRHPFAADTPAATIGRIVGGEPDLGGLPSELGPLVRQALSKAPESRPRAVDLVAILAGRDVSDSADAEQVATRIVRAARATQPAHPGDPDQFSYPGQAGQSGQPAHSGQPARTTGWPAPAHPVPAGTPAPGGPWAGWQTPPAPGIPPSDPRGRVASQHSPGSRPHQPNPWAPRPAGAPGNATPPPPPVPTPPEGRAAWFGQSTPVPLPLRITIAVAAVLAAIPVVFRAPGLVDDAGGNATDVWSIYHQFGIVFLALPVALAVLAAGERYAPLRDAAAGTAFGLAVAVAGELATLNQVAVRLGPGPGQDSGNAAGAGWWLLALAALAAAVAILGWRGLSDRWSPGRWAAAAAGTVTTAMLLFAPATPRWQDSSGPDATSLIVTAVVVGILGVATFVSQSGVAHFFIVLVAAGVCVLELAGPVSYYQESIFVAGSAVVMIAYLVIGLACNRFSTRMFLLTARICIAVGYLRIAVFPTIAVLADVDYLYTVAFGLVVVLAVLAARAHPPKSVWPTPYSAQQYGYYGRYPQPYQYPYQPR